MKGFTKFCGIALAILLAIGMSGCHDRVKPKETDLTLKSLSIFGKNAMSFTVEVENTVTKIESGNIVATFDYGNEKDKALAVEVTEGTLNVGTNTVTLTVKAVAGSYKAWTKDITVTRAAGSTSSGTGGSGGTTPTPTPTLTPLAAPTGLNAAAGTDAGSIKVVWTNVAGNNGYKLTYAKGGESAVTLTPAPAKDDVNAELTGLTAGADYTITLVALGDGTTSSNSSAATVTAKAKEAGGTTAVNAVKMVPIKLPASGQIVGAEPASGILPGEESWWKGVFIAGRTVKLSGFEMGESETTYALWKEVYDWATHADRGANKYTFANAGVKGSSDTGSDNEPVTTVNWRDVIVWCNAYTEMTAGSDNECVYRKAGDKSVLRNAKETYTEGSNTKYECDRAFFDKMKKGFRLPTEAEWEYAARANADGTLQPLNFLSGAEKDYKDAESCKAVAWYGVNSGDKTHPVKGKEKNGQNLYDMSGNVWEWCWDWNNNTVTAGDGGVNPVTDPVGAPSGSYRVRRGGSWNFSAGSCLPGDRDSNAPGGADDDLGFRLCRSRS